MSYCAWIVLGKLDHDRLESFSMIRNESELKLVFLHEITHHSSTDSYRRWEITGDNWRGSRLKLFQSSAVWWFRPAPPFKMLGELLRGSHGSHASFSKPLFDSVVTAEVLQVIFVGVPSAWSLFELASFFFLSILFHCRNKSTFPASSLSSVLCFFQLSALFHWAWASSNGPDVARFTTLVKCKIAITAKAHDITNGFSILYWEVIIGTRILTPMVDHRF